MEKKTFITLVMSVVGGMLFSLGMCMCLVKEWGAFNVGVVVGVVGVIELLLTWLIYRKMSGKKPIKLDVKLVGKVTYGIFATIVFGAGMAMVLAIESMMIPGVVVGIVGIVLLLCLIPMCIGFKESSNE